MLNGTSKPLRGYSSSLGLVLAALSLAGCGSSSSPPNAGTGGTGNPNGGTGDPNGGTSNPNGGTGSPNGGDGSAGTSFPGGGSGPDTSTPCTTEGSAGPSLPASFFSNCSACHSAYGSPANPAVPNLFSTKPAIDVFTGTVRAGKKLMPAFAADKISDADLAKIQAYFAAGKPASAPTCAPVNGNNVTAIGQCSGQTVTYAPNFASSATTRASSVSTSGLTSTRSASICRYTA